MIPGFELERFELAACASIPGAVIMNALSNYLGSDDIERFLFRKYPSTLSKSDCRVFERLQLWHGSMMKMYSVQSRPEYMVTIH